MHNEPSQRVLLVTHSNHALNDLFEKVMERDVDERYLLRLGRGSDELEVGGRDFSRFGRVNYMLARRMQLLSTVELIAKSIGMEADVGYTCETAGYFFIYHVLTRWEKFVKLCRDAQEVHDRSTDSFTPQEEQRYQATPSAHFPFGSFFTSPSSPLFSSASFTADLSVALSCFTSLQSLFTELEECLTGDHLVMTRSGWRSIKVIAEHDEVLSFNMGSQEMEWQLVLRTQRIPTAGRRLYRMASEAMDVVATGDHSMLTGRLGRGLRLVEGGDFKLESVDHLASLHYASSFTSSVTAFETRQDRAVVRGATNWQVARSIDIPRLPRVCAWWWQQGDEQRGLLRFLGMWLGDGSLDVTHGWLEVAQRKLQSTAWLIDLLDEVFPYWWRRTAKAIDTAGITFNYIIRCEPLYAWLREMAVGSPGYNPLYDPHLRAYPHYETLHPDLVQQLAEKEAASNYGPRHGVPLAWDESEMLAQISRGPRVRPCCECKDAPTREMLTCSGEHCYHVDKLRRAHPRCANRADDATAFDWPWYCSAAECQASKKAWERAWQKEYPDKQLYAATKKEKKASDDKKPPAAAEESDEDESESDEDESESEPAASAAPEVQPTPGPTRSGRQSHPQQWYRPAAPSSQGAAKRSRRNDNDDDDALLDGGEEDVELPAGDESADAGIYGGIVSWFQRLRCCGAADDVEEAPPPRQRRGAAAGGPRTAAVSPAPEPPAQQSGDGGDSGGGGAAEVSSAVNERDEEQLVWEGDPAGPAVLDGIWARNWRCECNILRQPYMRTCWLCSGENPHPDPAEQRTESRGAVEEEQSPVEEGEGEEGAAAPVTAVAGAQIVATGVVWNQGVWDIDCDGNWFYRKRWLGPNVAGTFSKLSQLQAVALLEGFNRADGEYDKIQFKDAARTQPKGTWIGKSSSMPLIQHLQLIAQLAGVGSRVTINTKKGAVRPGIKGQARPIHARAHNWKIRFYFTRVYGKHAKDVSLAKLAKPVDVTADIKARGYNDDYQDDGHVYCLTVAGNGNFLTQRFALNRNRGGLKKDEAGKLVLRGAGEGLHACTLFVGNCRPFELLRSYRERSSYLITHHARVIAMTCTHAAIKRHSFIAQRMQYDTVVMEESAQVLEIETFIPLLLQLNNPESGSRLKRVVLLGDHHQLPPVVKHRAFQHFAHLDQSLFTRLIRLGTPHIQLNAQGRSRPSLAALWSWRYSHLINLPNTVHAPHYRQANPGLLYDYQLINVDDYQGQGESTPSPFYYQNLGEAEYVVAFYQYLRLMGYPASRVSILTTYNGQKQLIRDVMAQRCERHPLFGACKVSTVDQYQGQQNDFILLSLVRTRHAGHLRDVRRLVVAMSRARLGLYVFARAALFANCFELTRTIGQMMQRPTRLLVLERERCSIDRGLWCDRKLEEVEGVAGVQEVADVLDMGARVVRLTREVQSEVVEYRRRVEAYQRDLQETESRRLREEEERREAMELLMEEEMRVRRADERAEAHRLETERMERELLQEKVTEPTLSPMVPTLLPVDAADDDNDDDADDEL